MTQTPVRVLFVCLGNICRSPTAHGVFRAKARAAGLEVVTDCAGTGDWHIGSPPDLRAQHSAAARGYDLSDLRARQLSTDDFARFDLILAMDQTNLRDIEARRPPGNTVPARLFRTLINDAARDVPDPYLTGDFDGVLGLIEHCADALLRDLQEKGQR